MFLKSNKGGDKNPDKIASFDEKQKAERRRKRILLFTPLVVGVTVLAGGFYLASSVFSGDSDSQAHVKKVATVTREEAEAIERMKSKDSVDSPEARFAEEVVKSKYGASPFKNKEWQRDAVKSREQLKSLEGEILKNAESNPVFKAGSILPSEKNGFTSSNEDYLLEDGSYNTNYSYWTQELFTVETEHILTTLLNPDYGDWKDIQYPDYDSSYNKKVDLKPFSLIFTKGFADKILKGEKMIPVYGDWNNNNYGRNDLTFSFARWFGEYSDARFDFKYSEADYQYEAYFTAPVTFKTKTLNNEVLEKTGTLKLKLVANKDDRNVNSPFRVLVDDASLEVN